MNNCKGSLKEDSIYRGIFTNDLVPLRDPTKYFGRSCKPGMRIYFLDVEACGRQAFVQMTARLIEHLKAHKAGSTWDLLAAALIDLADENPWFPLPETEFGGIIVSEEMREKLMHHHQSTTTTQNKEQR